MPIPSQQIGWSQRTKLLWQISKQLEQLIGVTSKLITTTTSTTTAAPLALKLLFDDIVNADSLVGDASNVGDWNIFFDLPTNGTSFTSVVIVGNEVELYGGDNITLKNNLFDVSQGISLLSIDDQSGCVIGLGNSVFTDDSSSGCPNLAYVNFPNALSLGTNCFAGAVSLTTIILPKLIIAGNNAFSSVPITNIYLPELITIGNSGFVNCTLLTSIFLPSCTDLGGSIYDDNVFLGISGNTITLTVPATLMTCNSGSPDGDIQYLQANNTVTIVTV